jgi:hypothetical protein
MMKKSALKGPGWSPKHKNERTLIEMNKCIAIRTSPHLMILLLMEGDERNRIIN